MQEPMRILGYARCRTCGTLVLEHVASQTAGRCMSCWSQMSPVGSLKVVNDGAKREIETASPTNRRKRNRHSRGRRETISAAANARNAALRRLRDLFPDLYQVFYDEERDRRGLVPIVRQSPIDYDRVVAETLTSADVYHSERLSGANDA